MLQYQYKRVMKLLRQAKTLKNSFIDTYNYQLNLYMVKLAESIETNYYQTLIFKISDYMSMIGNLYFKQLIKRMNVITQTFNKLATFFV